MHHAGNTGIVQNSEAGQDAGCEREGERGEEGRGRGGEREEARGTENSGRNEGGEGEGGGGGGGGVRGCFISATMTFPTVAYQVHANF